MRNNPQPNEIYEHFKGGLYKIVTLAIDSETEADVVVYQALYGNFKVYVRDLAMFMSRVDKEKYPQAAQEYRFELQTQIIGQQGVQPAQTSQSAQTEVQTEVQAEDVLEPMLVQFLEADTYEAKLNIAAGLHHRITNDMIDIMAASLDVEIKAGEAERRFDELKACLLTLEKYECNRLR